MFKIFLLILVIAVVLFVVGYFLQRRSQKSKPVSVQTAIREQVRADLETRRNLTDNAPHTYSATYAYPKSVNSKPSAAKHRYDREDSSFGAVEVPEVDSSWAVEPTTDYYTPSTDNYTAPTTSNYSGYTPSSDTPSSPSTGYSSGGSDYGSSSSSSSSSDTSSSSGSFD